MILSAIWGSVAHGAPRARARAPDLVAREHAREHNVWYFQGFCSILQAFFRLPGSTFQVAREHDLALPCVFLQFFKELAIWDSLAVGARD